jgi:hypothetical protein
MGEAAAVAAAMEAAVGKALAALPQRAAAGTLDHAAAIAQRRSGERMRDCVASYAPPRQAAVQWARRAVAAGLELTARGQHAVAADACFLPVCRLLINTGVEADVTTPAHAHGATGSSLQRNSWQQPEEKAASPSDDHLELQLQARLGLAACRSAEALARDPHLRHADALAAALRALQEARSAAQDALPREPLYHLVHDATVLIAEVAAQLVAAGLPGPALPFLVFAAKAAGASLTLAAPRHLAWRARLYQMAVQCYADCLRAGPPPDPPSSPPPPAGAATTKATASAAATSKGRYGGGDRAADAPPAEPQLEQPPPKQFLQPRVTLDQACAFLDDGIRGIRHLQEIQKLDPVPPKPEVSAAVVAAHSELLALRPLLLAAAADADAAAAAAAAADSGGGVPPSQPAAAIPRPAQQPQQQQQQQRGGGGERGVLCDAIKGLPSDRARLTTLLSLLAGTCSGGSPLHRREGQLPPALQPVLEEACDLARPALATLAALSAAETPRSVASAGAEEEAAAAEGSGRELFDKAEQAAQKLCPQLMQVLFVIAFKYRQAELFDQLQAAARGRVLLLSAAGASGGDAADASGGTREADKQLESGVAAVAALYEAAARLEGAVNPSSISQMAAALQEHAAAAAAQLPSLVAAAALALHSAADAHLLRGGFCCADAHAGDTLELLRALHAAFEACALDDGLLRGGVAVRLGVLLEERGELPSARLVAKQAVDALEQSRCEAASQRRGAADEHLLWLSASRTQQSDEAAAALSGESAPPRLQLSLTLSPIQPRSTHLT